MGGQNSKKDQIRNISKYEKSSSHRKKYLPQNRTSNGNSATVNGNGDTGSGGGVGSKGGGGGGGGGSGGEGGGGGVGGVGGGSSIEEAQVELPSFTERQKELVTETWRMVQEDMAKVGVIMFIKLFETHPEVQSVFMPFNGQSKENLRDSVQLKSHALRVMGTVDKCITRFHDPEKVRNMLHDLGARHVMYNAKVDYMDLIGPQFIWAIEPVLGDRWTPEVEQAWSDLFKYVSFIMKDAMSF